MNSTRSLVVYINALTNCKQIMWKLLLNLKTINNYFAYHVVLVSTARSVSIRDHSSDAKCTLVTKCAQDEKHLPPSLYWAQNLPSFFILCTNTTLSTSLILAVCRTRVMWTSQWTLLTVESLWLSDRASEHGIRGTEVRFLMGTQNFFLCLTLVTRRKTSFSSSLPSSKLTIFLILYTGDWLFYYYFQFSFKNFNFSVRITSYSLICASHSSHNVYAKEENN